MYIFEAYTNTFLLYLITRFASESSNTEFEDVLLGKKVPHIVFITNQQLLA